MRRARWIAGVAGDEGVTAFAIDGDSADLENTLTTAGMVEDGGEYVPEDGDFAVALGQGLVVFADDPGDAKPVVEKEDGKAPELVQLDGDGDLITWPASAPPAWTRSAPLTTPGKPGEIAFFDRDPRCLEHHLRRSRAGPTRVTGDSARITIPKAQEPQDEPPALLALQSFKIGDYDCGPEPWTAASGAPT